MTINKIYKDDSQRTTDSINSLYLKYDRILIILSEKDKNIYKFEQDHRKLKYNQLVNVISDDTKIVTNILKFTLLSWQGLINMKMYDKIIIRSNEFLKSFVHAFKCFYMNDAYNFDKPSIDVYVNDVNEIFCLYFQSIIDREYVYKPFCKCISINSSINENFLNYIKIKRMIKNKIDVNEKYRKIYNNLMILEQQGINEVIDFLKTFVKLENIVNVNTITADEENAKNLSEFYEKRKYVFELLKDHHVVLYSKNIIINETFTNLIHFCTSSELNIKNISTMACLVFWEDCYDKDDWLFALKFKKIIFFKSDKNFPEKFCNLIINNKNLELFKFNDYIKTSSKEYYTENKIGTINWDYSILLLEHIIYLITNLFSENYVFFKNYKIIKKYETLQNGTSYCCLMEVPNFVDDSLFTEVQRSNSYPVKKECCKDVAFNFIIKLYKNGFLDKNFLPIKQKFIYDNRLYHDLIKKAYKINYNNFDDLNKQINSIKEEFEDIEKFKKFYSINFEENLDQVCDIDEILRKQADCLKKFSDEMYVYCFNDSNIGISSSKSFTEEVTYKDVKISFLEKIYFTKHQRELLLYFQILFFGINFKRITNIQTNIRNYCYFVVPIKNFKIDFEYLESINKHFFFGSVYNVNDSNIFNNFLLFNPITKIFYEYGNDTDIKLSDSITNEMYKVLIKTKRNNNTIKDDDQIFNEVKENKNENLTMMDYFNKLYGVEIENITSGKNIIIECVLYSHKNKIRKPEIHSGEIMYVTSIKKSIRNDYKRFIYFFNVFESIAIAQEFKNKLSLDISISNIALAFTSKNITDIKIDLGYERFEFLGDSVLKFAITKFLFKDCGFPLNTLVTTKDSLICNNHLFKIGQNIDIKNYFSFNKYNENLFQPPAILDLVTNNKLINSLGVEKIFLNNNQYYFVVEHSKKKIKNEEDDDDFGKKVYADIIESLIGVHYIEYGFEKAWKFIKDIGIVNSILQTKQSFVNNTPNENLIDLNNISYIKKNYFLCDYEGILPLKSINLIEDIINYKFKNKGYIEKAMIHPSFDNNIFGSERFQKLELIGDCFYDLKVSDYIYKKYTDADPYELHTHRKRLVNNYTFAMILFKTGLVNLAKTGLNETSRDIQNNKLSKCYSDIFESLAGAVVIDSDFSFESSNAFFDRMLTYMKENSRDC